MEPQVITFEIPGKPQALKRHRAFRMGEHLRMVDPSAGDKADFLTIAMAHKPKVPLDEPLHVGCTFVFDRPKNHYRSGSKSHLLKDSAPYFHTGKPDTDNLTKFIGDALEGVFWKNDSCICRLEGLKVFANSGGPKMIITIQPAIPGNSGWLQIINDLAEERKAQ